VLLLLQHEKNKEYHKRSSNHGGRRTRLRTPEPNPIQPPKGKITKRTQFFSPN
jgi:hypothetical protein